MKKLNLRTGFAAFFWFVMLFIMIVFGGFCFGISFSIEDPLAEFFSWVYFLSYSFIVSAIGVEFYREYFKKI